MVARWRLSSPSKAIQSIAVTALAFLVALIGLFVGKWASVAAAAGSTAILWWLAGANALQGSMQSMAPFVLLLIWGMVLLSWSALYPLYTVVQWSWFYYTQACNNAEAGV